MIFLVDGVALEHLNFVDFPTLVIVPPLLHTRQTQLPEVRCSLKRAVLSPQDRDFVPRSVGGSSVGSTSYDCC
jgi:hypothetical protein